MLCHLTTHSQDVPNGIHSAVLFLFIWSSESHEWCGEHSQREPWWLVCKMFWRRLQIRQEHHQSPSFLVMLLVLEMAVCIRSWTKISRGLLNGFQYILHRHPKLLIFWRFHVAPPWGWHLWLSEISWHQLKGLPRNVWIVLNIMG